MNKSITEQFITFAAQDLCNKFGIGAYYLMLLDKQKNYIKRIFELRKIIADKNHFYKKEQRELDATIVNFKHNLELLDHEGKNFIKLYLKPSEPFKHKAMQADDIGLSLREIVIKDYKKKYNLEKFELDEDFFKNADKETTICSGMSKLLNLDCWCENNNDIELG